MAIVDNSSCPAYPGDFHTGLSKLELAALMFLQHNPVASTTAERRQAALRAVQQAEDFFRVLAGYPAPDPSVRPGFTYVIEQRMSTPDGDIWVPLAQSNHNVVELGLTMPDGFRVREYRSEDGCVKNMIREQCMPTVNGKPFRCTCGSNVFTRRGEYQYICNGCQAHYTGEPETKEVSDGTAVDAPESGTG